jgi:alpha-mannosidase
MNDCKYGISVNGSQIAVSLHKGGNHPDVKGDKGMHRAVYSFMPHNCSFGAKAVIQPSYMLNIPHIVSDGIFKAKALVNTDKPNIIVESVKPCEEEDRAFILRIYEAEGTRTNCTVNFGENIKKFTVTNMLEEETSTATDGNIFTTQFRPFEIKTVKAYY